MVHGSWLKAHGSWLKAHGSWLMAHGQGEPVHVPWGLVPEGAPGPDPAGPGAPSGHRAGPVPLAMSHEP